MDDLELVKRIKAGTTLKLPKSGKGMVMHSFSADAKQAGEELVNKHSGLIHKLARKFSTKNHDDLVQIAGLCMLKAATTFNVEKGFKFTTFAGNSITKTLMTHDCVLNQFIDFPRDLHFKSKMKGRKKYRDIASKIRVESMHKKVRDEEFVSDFLVSKEPSVNSLTEFDIFDFDRVKEIIKSLLSEREFAILWLRIVEDLPQQEIADRFGTSKQRVQQILKKSLDLCKHRFKNESMLK